MNINTDINILSNLPDLDVLKYLFDIKYLEKLGKYDHHGFSDIKSLKSLKRFERAVRKSLLNFKSDKEKYLIDSVFYQESVSNDLRVLLFWNLSNNNDLFQYLNENVYFPALYSGRITIKSSDIQACIKDLLDNTSEMEKWTPITVAETSSSYLRLLKKFNLMEGGLTKKFSTPYLDDKMFLLFIYWLKAVEEKSNLLESEWLKYSFCERPIFIERLMQKKFSNYFQLQFSGDNLKIETLIPYENIYHAIR
jgi:hypothetical protein